MKSSDCRLCRYSDSVTCCFIVCYRRNAEIRATFKIYTLLNQYHVVLEVEPPFWQNPDGLQYIYARSANSNLPLVPLSAFTHYAPSTTALAVNHQGQFPAVTL